MSLHENGSSYIHYNGIKTLDISGMVQSSGISLSASIGQPTLGGMLQFLSGLSPGGFGGLVLSDVVPCVIQDEVPVKRSLGGLQVYNQPTLSTVPFSYLLLHLAACALFFQRSRSTKNVKIQATPMHPLISKFLYSCKDAIKVSK
ncbi:hypothetical protein HHK36_004519 [Tetracentron sinense]|uniref:Uncharacterized protein n=1 Tax=Tetracentron sinense TaxID=13715 RepID=A0A835DQC4_TETSI|nr:hypothetical protein HHK36_004519 [Tetracentron sinense]